MTERNGFYLNQYLRMTWTSFWYGKEDFLFLRTDIMGISFGEFVFVPVLLSRAVGSS